MVGYSGSRLDPSIYKVFHVKIQALITDQLISKCWGKFIQTILNMIFLRTSEMNLILLRSDNINIIWLRRRSSTPEINYSVQYLVITIPPPFILCLLLIIRWKQPRLSTDYHKFSLKSYLSILIISLLDQVSSKLLRVYGTRKSVTSPDKMIYIMRKQCKVYSRVQISRHCIYINTLKLLWRIKWEILMRRIFRNPTLVKNERMTKQ